MNRVFGYDTSTNALHLLAKGHTDPKHAFDLGWRKIMRYLAPLPNSKVLTKGEAELLHSVGLDVGPNFEIGADDALKGRDAGIRNANTAIQQLVDMGCPKVNADGTPIAIYYSSDTVGVSAKQVRPYFEGCKSVGEFKVGAYGGSIPMVPLLNDGVIDFFWQSESGAGSGFKKSVFPSHAEAHIRQFFGRPHDIPFPADPGGSIDLDEFLQAECGLWKSSKSPAPAQVVPMEEEMNGLELNLFQKAQLGTFAVDNEGNLVHRWFDPAHPSRGGRANAAGGGWHREVVLTDLNPNSPVIGPARWDHDGFIHVFASKVDGSQGEAVFNGKEWIPFDHP